MKFSIFHITCISIILCIAGCIAPNSTRVSERNNSVRGSAPYFGSFDKIWNERTITLPPAGNSGPGMLFPFSGESNSDETFAFPLTIRATYMDSALVNVGFKEFCQLARMSESEQSAYVEKYKKAHITNDTLFIWAEIQTTFTSEFLNLRRWTIFLENEEGKQFEPSRILEYPIEQSNRKFYPPGDRNKSGSPLVPDFRFTNLIKKNVELYFPVRRFDDSLFTANTTHLKFVILDTEHPLVRAESSWTLTSAEHH